MSRREFQLIDGSSQKFWTIEVAGPRFTVQFGRIGTAGQTQTKEFGSDAEAQTAADKLIAEKTKKGYAEVGAAAAPAAPAKAAKPKKSATPAPAPPITPAVASPLEVTHTIDLAPTNWYVASWRKLPPLPVTEAAAAVFRSSAPAIFGDELRRQGISEPDERALDLILDEKLMNRSFDTATFALEWFLPSVLPYLAREVLESRRDQLRALLKKTAWPTDPSRRPSPAYYLAGAAGLHDEVLAIVSSLPDDAYGTFDWDDYYHQPQFVVFGLGSADLVNRHMRRLRLCLKKPAHARGWLAHTELIGLDYLRDSIARLTNKKDAEKVFDVLSLVMAPEAAPHVLELYAGSKVQKAAGEWLDANPGNAIAGLIPSAGGKGKLAEAAIDYLRTARKQGHTDFIAEQLKAAPADIAAPVREAVLEHEEKVYPTLDPKTAPKPLRDALAKTAAPPPLPSWAAPANLPPLRVGEKRLDDNAMSLVLGTLRRAPLGTLDPLLAAVKEQTDSASRDAFAWKLFELWLANGASSKEKWALLALGHLGTDATALRLTPLVRAWPGESQHQRAILGLECLRAIGTDTALMQLNGIAQKLKFQGLKNKAKEFMEAIAKDRGLSRDELEDRIVPDLDLDERGGRTFDFGPRQFRVVLGPDLTPLVRDADGKVKGDLPKPGAKDDSAKATAAVADWKLLKKQLRETLKVQAPRLEQAMVTGRRWTVEQFETLLVRHPLMTNLARRLLWAGYDGKGKLAATFRVAEEQEYADVQDRPFALKGLATVGIVHPLNLTEEQRSAWGQVFGDYEIIGPFPQLGRPVLSLERDEAKAKTITRLAKVKLAPAAVRWTLEKFGWERGSASDHGMIQEFFKHFPGAEVTALLEVAPGIPIGMPDWADQQTIPRVFYRKGAYTPVDYPYHKEKDFPSLNKVDAVAVSEVLSDLATLASKGTTGP